MAITTAAVSVTTAVTLLSTPNDPGRQHVVVSVPGGGATVFVGGADVTTTSGLPVAAGTSFDVNLDVDDRLHGIVVGPGAQTVNVFRQGV